MSSGSKELKYAPVGPVTAKLCDFGHWPFAVSAAKVFDLSSRQSDVKSSVATGSFGSGDWLDRFSRCFSQVARPRWPRVLRAGTGGGDCPASASARRVGSGLAVEHILDQFGLNLRWDRPLRRGGAVARGGGPPHHRPRPLPDTGLCPQGSSQALHLRLPSARFGQAVDWKQNPPRFRSDRAAAAFEAKLQDHSRFLASGLMLGFGTKLRRAASVALWVQTRIVSRLPLPA